MKWISHVAVASSIAAPIDAAAVPIAALGSTAPDWLEWVLKATGQEVRHRDVTHYLALWVLVLVFSIFLWDYSNWLFWFSIGALTHWLCDSLTIQGVPIGWWSRRRVHLFGGRIRTGSAAEYGFVAAVVGISALITGRVVTEGFIPFFYDWAGLYETGIIDGSEWRANRFRFL